MSRLCSVEVKLHFEFLGVGNDAFGLRIIVRIAVGEGQHAILYLYRTPQRNIQIPVCHLTKCLTLREIGLGGGVLTDGHGDTAYPHILFVVGVGHPEVTVLRNAVAFLDATHVLGTITLILSSMTEGCHFAIHEVQGRIVKAVFTQ